MVKCFNHPFKSRSSLSAVMLVLFMAFLMGSCQNKAVLDQSLAVDQHGWSSRKMAHFEVPIKDTLSTYSFFIHIRHLENYRYSNLYVFLHTRFPNGTATRDTIECVLAKPDGEWLGKSSGSLRENKILLNGVLRFPVAGTYSFDIEQAMREQALEGIHDIGLRIVRNKND